MQQPVDSFNYIIDISRSDTIPGTDGILSFLAHPVIQQHRGLQTPVEVFHLVVPAFSPDLFFVFKEIFLQHAEIVLFYIQRVHIGRRTEQMYQTNTTKGFCAAVLFHGGCDDLC